MMQEGRLLDAADLDGRRVGVDIVEGKERLWLH